MSLIDSCALLLFLQVDGLKFYLSVMLVFCGGTFLLIPLMESKRCIYWRKILRTECLFYPSSSFLFKLIFITLERGCFLQKGRGKI